MLCTINTITVEWWSSFNFYRLIESITFDTDMDPFSLNSKYPEEK